MYANGSIDVYWVGSFPVTGSNQFLIVEGNAASTDKAAAYAKINGGASKLQAVFVNDGGFVTLNTPYTPDGSIDETTKQYGVRDSGSGIIGSVNGVDEANVPYTRSGTVTVDRFALMAWVRNIVVDYAEGDINEIVITDTLSSDDRTLMETYLATKWGL